MTERYIERLLPPNVLEAPVNLDEASITNLRELVQDLCAFKCSLVFTVDGAEDEILPEQILDISTEPRWAQEEFLRDKANQVKCAEDASVRRIISETVYNSTISLPSVPQILGGEH